MGDDLTTVFEELAVVGKAFASPKRLALIELLSQGERTVDGLSRASGMGVSTVSAHLQILKMSALVRTRRECTHVHYRLASDEVASVYAALRATAHHHSADVRTALAAHLGVDDVAEVGHDELAGRLGASDLLLLDVRPAEEYAAGHIPGATSYPFALLSEELADDVARDWSGRDVITYCRGAYCVMAHDAVRLLRGQGVDVRRLQQGLLEWRLTGRPVEVGA